MNLDAQPPSRFEEQSGEVDHFTQCALLDAVCGTVPDLSWPPCKRAVAPSVITSALTFHPRGAIIRTCRQNVPAS